MATPLGTKAAGFQRRDLPSSGESSAYAINDAGQIVGFDTYGGRRHAVIWTRAGETDVGTLPGGSESEADAINAAGTAVGASTTGSDQSLGQPGSHATLWRLGKATDLGTLPGDDTSLAIGINAAGQIVGRSEGQGLYHPFLWEQGKMTRLATLGGPWNAAQAINSQGVIVGWSSDHSFRVYPVRWDRGHISRLPLLPGDTEGGANAINDAGQIVGETSAPCNGCPVEGGLHAVVWQQGKAINLGQGLQILRIDGSRHPPLGSEAKAINAAGDVSGVVYDVYNGDRQDRAAFWLGATAFAQVDFGAPGMASTAEADGINDQDQLVGLRTVNPLGASSGPAQAVEWQA